jgi:hypothetical protein
MLGVGLIVFHASLTVSVWVITGTVMVCARLSVLMVLLPIHRRNAMTEISFRVMVVALSVLLKQTTHVRLFLTSRRVATINV